MNTTDTNIQTTAARMLVTLSRAQLGMCDRILATIAKASNPRRQTQLLATLQETGGFLSQFTTIEDLTHGTIEAITATEINAIFASEDDFDTFAMTQFPNEAGASQFMHTDVHTLFDQITTFHRLMDDLEAQWEVHVA